MLFGEVLKLELMISVDIREPVLYTVFKPRAI
jgi:hypothetical protein